MNKQVINSLSELKPYKSLLLGRISDGKPVKGIVTDLLDDLNELLSLTDNETRQLISRANEIQSGELLVGYLHYVEEQRTPWTLNSQVVDQVNQLVLVCRRSHHVAIYLSDTSWRSAILKSFGNSGFKGLALLRKIEPGLLNAAFVKGDARTLWLSGAHARTPIKADNKILSGIALQDALDPLGDQTYYFTAARCASDFDSNVSAVGASPRGSRIWVGGSRSWTEFVKPVAAILKHLEGIKKPDPAPIPIVAVPSADTSQVAEAFDFALVPPELLSDDPLITEQTREEMEEWAYYTNFTVVKRSNADFTTEVVHKNQLLGTIDFKPDLSDPDNVKLDLAAAPVAKETEADLARVIDACYRRSWVKIWYETGHTISDATIIEMRHRDFPFEDFIPVNFSEYSGGGNYEEYDVAREKPTPLNLGTIGNQDSLFCWVKNSWPIGSPGKGWLACDDGAGEIADFIHLDDTNPKPKLSLIHVKAAKRAGKRDIAVAMYEVVTSQAIKNLRNLDRILLAEGLDKGKGLKKAAGRAVKELVWFNGKKTSRDKMLAALAKIGSSFEREVIILQPHLIKQRVDEARKNPKNDDAKKLRLLDTLLIAQANSCHGIQARLRVVYADEPDSFDTATVKRGDGRAKPRAAKSRSRAKR